jgi:hypothetical protein
MAFSPSVWQFPHPPPYLLMRAYQRLYQMDFASLNQTL